MSVAPQTRSVDDATEPVRRIESMALDPDETQPDLPVVNARPPMTLAARVRHGLDDATHTLARKCAAWAHHGCEVTDLAGIWIEQSWCGPFVVPRSTIESRYPRAHRALARTPSPRDRLPVVAVPRDDGDLEVHAVAIPRLDWPDAGVLPVLSASQRQQVAERVETARWKRDWLVRWMTSHPLAEFCGFVPSEKWSPWPALHVEDRTQAEKRYGIAP
jgi:hypothetical protein